MPLPRAVPVTLTAADRTTLTKRARGAKTAHRDRLRARIVLAAARGWGNARIAADLQITVDTVRKWPGRFADRGLDGLADLPRCGRPRRISELTRAAVVALACQLPAATGVPLSRWTGPELLAEVTRAGTDCELSVSSVLRILAGHPVKPWQYQSWISPPRPGLQSQSGRDPGPVPGVLPGRAAAAGRPDPVGRCQALHPGPRPLPSHRPGRARHARTGRA
jgi:transposase